MDYNVRKLTQILDMLREFEMCGEGEMNGKWEAVCEDVSNLRQSIENYLY